jgi:hypothetical protein
MGVVDSCGLSELDIEMVFDPVQAAYEGGRGIVFDPAIHVVVENRAIQDLRRDARNPRLCLIRNLETGTWVLGSWFYVPDFLRDRVPEAPGGEHGPGLFVEIRAYPEAPQWGFPDRETLLLAFRDPDAVRDSVVSRIRRRRQEQEAQRIARGQERHDTARWLRRKGLELEAHWMETGRTPFAASWERDPEAARDAVKSFWKLLGKDT